MTKEYHERIDVLEAHNPFLFGSKRANGAYKFVADGHTLLVHSINEYGREKVDKYVINKDLSLTYKIC